MLDRDGHDIDVHALHRGYLRAHAAAGGVTLLNAQVSAMTRAQDQWQLTTRQGVVSAPVVVNAAGAWAQQRLIKNAPKAVTESDLAGLFRGAMQYW